VLLYCHELNDVVAQRSNARQHIFTKLLVGTHAQLLSSHADMRLVNQRIFYALGLRVFPLVGLVGVPHLRRKEVRFFVLHHAAAVRWNALTAAVFPHHKQLVVVAMLERIGRQRYFPIAIADTFQPPTAVGFPTVEVANEVNVLRVGRPLAQHPTAARAVQPIVQVVVGNVSKGTLACGKFFLNFLNPLNAPVNNAFVRFQPEVVGYEQRGFHGLLMLSL